MSAESMREHAAPEPPSIAARRVLLIAIGFLLFVAATIAALGFYFARNVPGTLTLKPAAFPEPKLQSDPHGDLQRLQAEQRQAISDYAWADKDKGLIRIPIERAMALIAARGREALEPLDKPAVTPMPGSRGGAAP